MSSQTNFDDIFLLVDGLRVPKSFNLNLFHSALQYQAQSDDIFSITYPRSGTNRMLVIIYTLMTNGQAFNKNMADYLSRMMFLEQSGKEMVEKIVRPGVIQTHLPFNYVPYNSKSKYIAVIRHPKDVCVSLYQLVVENPESEYFCMNFNTFFELFIANQTIYAGYFEHLRLIWSHKDDENVLLVSFEQMKHDLRGIVQKVAQFLDIDIDNNKALLDKVEIYASFDYMKENYNSCINDALAQQAHSPKHPLELVRKGQVGDWKSYMTDEQSQKFDAILAEKMHDMKGLEDYWFPSSNSNK